MTKPLRVPPASSNPYASMVAQWRRAGPMLEEARQEELKALKDSDIPAIAASLLDLGHRFAQPRDTSGLIEQQRWFRKLHR